ncbi:DegT/DnrJ/EryC1/StrS family aminotransferase [Thermocrinis sp.]|uniref:DegT/DnrJ/EryC1/StrS family aminotransferase n=1 Tax=Thermocrinis sp. TaxID=2024383 RepID=UPI002FDE540B
MINIIEPRFFEEEKQAIIHILESHKITRGEWTKFFEESFAKYLGVKHAFTVCSGTVALFIALKALKVEGERVIVPAMSFMATIDAVYLAGGIPVVVDVDEYYTMDPNQLEDAAKKYNPKVVIPVHLYGQPADMHAINYLSEKYGFIVLEDAAQAHGAEFFGKKTGSLGHLSAFSFYASKNVPMGEGGVIATDDDKIAKEVKKWIDFGEHPAFNVRITEFQAAIGAIQLKYLDERNRRRREIAKRYSESINSNFIHPSEREGAYHVYHLYTLRHKERNRIISLLKENGIDARVYYSYLLNELRGAEHLPLTNAERFKKEVFSIPVHPYLTEEEVEKIIHSLKAVEVLV